MIPEDRELLAELSRLNREMTSLALHIMDGSATATEQQKYTERLIAAGEQLRQRARKTEEWWSRVKCFAPNRLSFRR